MKNCAIGNVSKMKTLRKWNNCIKWDKSGTFKDQISVHLGAPRQNVVKSGLKNFWIGHLWAKSDIHDANLTT